MERIQKSTEGYSSENIWNMDKSVFFWQRTSWKRQRSEGWQKSKQRFTIAFFVNAAGEKIDKPLVIWKSKKPRCFKHLSDKSRPADVHYFSNPKSWMTSDVMQAVLTRFNRKLFFEQRKVVLILDNATCHPISIIDSFSQRFFYLRTQLRDSNHLMLGLFKTLRWSIGGDSLSMYMLELMNTLPQRKLLKMWTYWWPFDGLKKHGTK